GDRSGPPGRVHRPPALRRRRRVDAQVHRDADRPRVRRPHPLREGRDGGARPGEPALLGGDARRPRRARARRAGRPRGGDPVERPKHDAVTERLLRAHGVYRWYRARAAGDAVIVFDRAGRELARFEFPRQTDGERLCLADYVRDDVDDSIALFAVTCGEGVRELAARWKDRGEYVRSHALGALAIECAEAFAEMLHARLRTLWGFPDPPDLAISEKLKGRYRGIRVSFGYPACPNLADQQTLFRLLAPATIGPDP